jgi:sirohydrochlorin ferrochelatase
MQCVNQNAIILFSHGSLLCGAGETLRCLAEWMRSRGDAPIVEPGYLNYSEPPFEQAVDKCVAAGASRIVVAPYFLIAGYFVQVSLKPKIEAAREKYPQVEFLVADAMKTHAALADALIECAGRAAPPSQWRTILNTAPRFCRNNPECPLNGGEKCPATSNAEWGVRNTEGGVGSVRGEVNSALHIHNSALLVMVHGSPRPESNGAMFDVVDEVRRRGVFADIEVGFMECNEPDIPSAIDALVARGALSVVAVPYFLHAGTHVADDLPGLLEEAQERHPQVQFAMGDYIGRDLRLADVMRDRVQEALSRN